MNSLQNHRGQQDRLKNSKRNFRRCEYWQDHEHSNISGDNPLRLAFPTAVLAQLQSPSTQHNW